MSSELYDALIEAGASEDKARKAAEAVAAYEARFTRIESDLTQIKWGIGTLIVLVLFIAGKVWIR
jgi:hypothetical protein